MVRARVLAAAVLLLYGASWSAILAHAQEDCAPHATATSLCSPGCAHDQHEGERHDPETCVICLNHGAGLAVDPALAHVAERTTCPMQTVPVSTPEVRSFNSSADVRGPPAVA
jgi:hypothetical protein